MIWYLTNENDIMCELLCILKEQLRKGRYTESTPIKIHPRQTYHIEFDIQETGLKSVKIAAEYLYLKSNIPFVASKSRDEVSVELLKENEISNLILFLSNK